MAMAAAKQLLLPPLPLKFQKGIPSRLSSSTLISMRLYLSSSLPHTLPACTRRLRTAKRVSVGNSTSPYVGGRGGSSNGKKGAIVTSSRASEEAKAQVRRSLARVKRRTRSDLGFDRSHWEDHHPGGIGVGVGGGEKERGATAGGHVPVMLGEVLEVFRRRQLHSFVDCTLGAAGHSTALIKAHPEMNVFIGLDVDPTALAMAQSRIDGLLKDGNFPSLRAHTHLSNFKDVKSVIRAVANFMDNHYLSTNGIDGILMDLGMSSMQVDCSERGFSILAHGPLDMRMNPQASVKAEDILNSWPEADVGLILQEYGEESNWRLLLRKIMDARRNGGLHSTTDLVGLIQSSSRSGGRRGWIKTAARVFQALRIAVNDELNALEDGLYACFDCLSPGGRLAVISFHSLEDRIVKHAFLSIVDKEDGIGQEYSIKQKDDDQECSVEQNDDSYNNEETWRNGRVAGKNGYVLTRRPITPSEDEEKMNPRSRSAKLRIIQKR